MRLPSLGLTFALLAVGFSGSAQEKNADPNTLSKAEADDGFVSIFDGKTLAGWTGATKGYVAGEGRAGLPEKRRRQHLHRKGISATSFSASTSNSSRAATTASPCAAMKSRSSTTTPTSTRTSSPASITAPSTARCPPSAAPPSRPANGTARRSGSRATHWKVTVNGMVIVDADISKVEGLEAVAKQHEGPHRLYGPRFPGRIPQPARQGTEVTPSCPRVRYSEPWGVVCLTPGFGVPRRGA